MVEFIHQKLHGSSGMVKILLVFGRNVPWRSVNRKKETLQGQHQIAVLDAVDGVLTHLFVLQDRRQGNAEEEEKAVDQVFEQVVVVVLVLWRVPERDAEVKAQHYQGYCWRNAWKEWFILTTSNSR